MFFLGESKEFKWVSGSPGILSSRPPLSFIATFHNMFRDVRMFPRLLVLFGQVAAGFDSLKPPGAPPQKRKKRVGGYTVPPALQFWTEIQWEIGEHIQF